jgi:hypothetical protein
MLSKILRRQKHCIFHRGGLDARYAECSIESMFGGRRYAHFGSRSGGQMDKSGMKGVEATINNAHALTCEVNNLQLRRLI